MLRVGGDDDDDDDEEDASGDRGDGSDNKTVKKTATESLIEESWNKRAISGSLLIEFDFQTV